MPARSGGYCKRGHDTTRPGALNSHGACKECIKIVGRERRAAIRAGTHKWRNPICKHGHDMRIVGISGNGNCKECYRARKRRETKRNRELGIHRPVEHRRPICPRGHDKRIVGVADNGGCYRCYLDALAASSMRLRKRRAGFDGEPQKVPNLKAIRFAAGMTAVEMARYIGISLGGYLHLECGRRRASRKSLAKMVAAISELRRDATSGYRGRYGRLLWAINEAERRGMPTAQTIGELAGENRATGILLRELKKRGLAERFEPRPGPKGGRNLRNATWLLTEEGRRLMGGAAA